MCLTNYVTGPGSGTCYVCFWMENLKCSTTLSLVPPVVFFFSCTIITKLGVASDLHIQACIWISNFSRLGFVCICKYSNSVISLSLVIWVQTDLCLAPRKMREVPSLLLSVYWYCFPLFSIFDSVIDLMFTYKMQVVKHNVT